MKYFETFSTIAKTYQDLRDKGKNKLRMSCYTTESIKEKFVNRVAPEQQQSACTKSKSVDLNRIAIGCLISCQLQFQNLYAELKIKLEIKP